MKKADEFAKSQQAVQEYRGYKVENEQLHKALVMVKRDGNLLYSGTIEVEAKVDNNYSCVTIMWNEKEEELYHPTYINRYQLFEYCGNGLLVIKNTTDRNGNKIEIEIM